MIELPPPLWLPSRPAIIRPADAKLLRHEASFMPGMFPAGVAASKAPPAISYIGTTANETDLTTYTFTNHAIGAADPTRRVVVSVNLGYSIASGQTLLSATIAGIAATIHVNMSGANVNAWISALVPTGTTANIVVTANGANCRRCAVMVYRAVNETVTTPHQTVTDNTLTSATLSVAINIPAGGWVAAAAIFNGNATVTWVGVTEQYDLQYAEVTIPRSGGFASGLPAEAGRTVSATASLVPGASVLAAISWG